MSSQVQQGWVYSDMAYFFVGATGGGTGGVIRGVGDAYARQESTGCIVGGQPKMLLPHKSELPISPSFLDIAHVPC